MKKWKNKRYKTCIRGIIIMVQWLLCIWVYIGQKKRVTRNVGPRFQVRKYHFFWYLVQLWSQVCLIISKWNSLTCVWLLHLLEWGKTFWAEGLKQMGWLYALLACSGVRSPSQLTCTLFPHCIQIQFWVGLILPFSARLKNPSVTSVYF